MITGISEDHFTEMQNMEPPSKKIKTEEAVPGVRQEGTPATEQKKGILLTYIMFRITGSKTKGDDDFFEFLDCTPWIPEFGYQLEKGKKNGIDHYQGTFKCEPRKRELQVQDWFKEKFPEVEFPVKDYCRKSLSEAANRYGMKEDTRVSGPWYKGPIFEEIAKETVYKVEIQLRPWQEKIVKILKEPQDDRIIWWFWEPKGGLGKTTFQKWLYQNLKGVIPLSGKSADMKNGVIEYMETNNGAVPKIILVNLPKTFNHDYFSYEGTEAIKDMWFYSGKYKGGVVCARSPHLMIFANQRADVERLSASRWNIIRLPDGKGERDDPLEEVWSD